MSANVGLSTPRGSGTSGYVQKNMSLLRQHNRDRGGAYPTDPDDFRKHQQRQPDPEILEHDRKRRIENKVFELRDRLEDEEVDEDEIEKQVDELRQRLEAEDSAKSSGSNVGRPDTKGLKSHQVHDLAQAKIEETEKLRRALGIRADYEEGSHWKKGEERMRDAIQEARPSAPEGERPEAASRGRARTRSRSVSTSLSRSRSASTRGKGRKRTRYSSDEHSDSGRDRRRRKRSYSSGEDEPYRERRRQRRSPSGERYESRREGRRSRKYSSDERSVSPRERRRPRDASPDDSRSPHPRRGRRASPEVQRRRERSYSRDSDSDDRRSYSR